MFRQHSALQIVFVVLAAIGLFSVSLVAAQGVAFEQMADSILPWDAVPSPDGSIIYFTGIGADGVPGVFSVPAAGGESNLVSNASPLAMPLGLAISTDGQTLYVSDPWMAGSSGGGLYTLPLASAQAQLIEGTQGTAPQGVEVISQEGADQVYFTGIDPSDGQPAVYRVAASGGDVTLIAKGAPLIAPSGIAIAQDGTIYVLDHLASGNGLGGVVRIQGESAEIIARDVRTGGQLAGLTLTMDGALLLASSLDNTAGTAQVLVVDLATLQTSIVNDVISANTAAGGLHRAHNDNIFAWADITAGTAGTVYKVQFK